MNSEFQFSEPKLVNISFNFNNDFVPNDEKINIEFKAETEIKAGPEGPNSAFVILRVTLGEKGSKTPFYIYAEEMAAFKWENTDVYGVKPDVLLKSNAPALLLSYLRPIISMITSSSVIGTYNIPFMNFKDGN